MIFFRRYHRLDAEQRRGGRHGIQDLALFLARRIANIHLKHEAVELRLGQLVGSLLLDRVLRRENKKGIGKRVAGVADRHLSLLHRFEQGALDLCRRAIDLIGKDEI